MKLVQRICWKCLLLSTFFLGLSWPISAGAQISSNEIIQLGPLIQEALQNNPELVAEQALVEAMIERVPQSKSLEDPELTLRLWNTPNSLDVTRSDRTIIGLGQQFPYPGTLSQQEHIAEKVVEQAEQRLAGKKREIIAAVKVAYYELFYAHQAIEIHHQEAKRLKQFFDAATAKFRVGKGTQVDVLKAQVEQSKWFQHLPILEQQKQTARAHLNTMLNRDAEASLGVPLEPMSEPKPLSWEHLQNQAVQQRPEILEAGLAVQQFDSTIKLAELQTYPHLRVEAQRWLNRNEEDGFGGIVSINLPFAFWTKPKIEVELLKVQKEMTSAHNAVFVARASLNSLTGKPLETQFKIQGSFKSWSEDMNLNTLITQALHQHPTREKFQKLLAQAQQRLREEKLTRVPNVTLSGSYERDAGRESFLGGLTVPLPLWYQREGEIANALGTQHEIEADLLKWKNDTMKEVTQNFHQSQANAAQINTYKKGLLKQAEEAVRIARVSFQYGQASLLEMLDAQRVLWHTILEYTKAQYDLSIALTELERSIGGEIL
ncbi:TolC family protein [Candidatus Nitronereus thalassa]|uniref:TolC family protein n=1 Tax=Candidatus Nitronereus thalassa TaxID=3020898 RepID=A0ABU3K320_9BACT|nr:TolC family protein [Candidatus Nitronereus thalassa]MDT7040787.1 TolC family protein [Candidatus Nitronereus thalassa]